MEDPPIRVAAARESWGARRLRYNVGLIVAGVAAFALYVWAFEVRCLSVPEAEITLFTTAFQAVGYAIAIGLANLCYQLGPMLERMIPVDRVNSCRRAAYGAGVCSIDCGGMLNSPRSLRCEDARDS